MVGNRWGTRLAGAAVAGAAALLAVGLTACTSSPSSTGTASPTSSASPAVPGGTARVALPAATALNWIWPYVPKADASQYNVEGFQRLLYRPLYMFGDNGPSFAVNYPLSTAEAPAYSDGGKTVTITMKGWKWNDGESVDASDVVFWLNMMRAQPAGYYGYVAGQLPDNLASYSAVGTDTVVLHLKTAVSSIWFTYDQLAEITPMPAAWDVTSAGANAGSGGCATDSVADNWARCDAVFQFLTAQAKNAQAYATSPLWGVVDGPWKLSSFSTAAAGPVASFVPNTAYSGSQKPVLANVTYYAYPDATSEYKALKNGQLDFGYVPPQEMEPVTGTQTVPASSPLGASYTLSPAYPFGIQYLVLNFNNPRVGPAFRQLYVRQALQELVDQESMITTIDRGYGYPTSGAVPSQLANQWVPPNQTTNSGVGPYSFSVSNATSLLTSHGWKQGGGGVLACETPALCGPGVAAGSTLSLTLAYLGGSPAVQQEVEMVKSDALQAGIQINTVAQSPGTIADESAPCTPGAKCNWDMLLDSRNFDGPGFEPTGEQLFATGSPANPGSYSDPTEDKLIGLTHTSDSLAVYQQYATYTAEQLPFIWMPTTFSVTATSSRLANVWSNPLALLLPEYWYFTS
jgi:peptide/nickel transport system substrate-binding protein